MILAFAECVMTLALVIIGLFPVFGTVSTFGFTATRLAIRRRSLAISNVAARSHLPIECPPTKLRTLHEIYSLRIL